MFRILYPLNIFLLSLVAVSRPVTTPSNSNLEKIVIQGEIFLSKMFLIFLACSSTTLACGEEGPCFKKVDEDENSSTTCAMEGSLHR